MDAALLEKKRLRHFGWILTGLLLVAGLALRHKDMPLWLVYGLWGFSGFALVASFVSPPALKPVERVLIRIGDFMAPIFTCVLLTIVFFLVLTPIALLTRLLDKKPLQVDIDKESASYWIPHDPDLSRRHERQY